MTIRNKKLIWVGQLIVVAALTFNSAGAQAHHKYDPDDQAPPPRAFEEDGIHCVSDIPDRAKILHVYEVVDDSANSRRELAARLRLNAERFLVDSEDVNSFSVKYDRIYIALSPKTESKRFLGNRYPCMESEYHRSLFSNLLGVATLGLSDAVCGGVSQEVWELDQKAHVIIFGIERTNHQQALFKQSIGCSYVKNVDDPRCLPGGAYDNTEMPNNNLGVNILDDLTNQCSLVN